MKGTCTQILIHSAIVERTLQELCAMGVWIAFSNVVLIASIWLCTGMCCFVCSLVHVDAII